MDIEWLEITTHTYEYNDLDYPIKVDGETVYEYEWPYHSEQTLMLMIAEEDWQSSPADVIF